MSGPWWLGASGSFTLAHAHLLHVERKFRPTQKTFFDGLDGRMPSDVCQRAFPADGGADLKASEPTPGRGA
jgi:hypothetical protein